MAEGKKGGEPEPGSGRVPNPASSFESAGGRLRFTVELRPEETTIVSWKKLLREANSSKSSRPGPSVSGPEVQDQPESQPPPPPPPVPDGATSLEMAVEKEQKDSQGQVGPTRLSNVIERIERMYAGNGSSDDEDVMLDNVPDDDEYDTDDSFIDDTELDNYFQVDHSEVKHQGFFVNRGKLERVEPTNPSNQQPKKRRRKDLVKGQNESYDGLNPNKTAKMGNKGKITSSVVHTNLTNQSHSVGMPIMLGEDIQFQAAPVDAAEISIKKKASYSHAESSSVLVDGGAIKQSTNIDRQRLEIPSSKEHSSKMIESEPHHAVANRSNDKSSYASKAHSGKQPSKVDDLAHSGKQPSKVDDLAHSVARFDLSVPTNRDSVPTTKAALVQGKVGSTVRSKTTKLEKAVRELEKIVAESRPPSTEVQDADNSSQAVKKRVPREIKDKLSQIANFALNSYGEIPVDLINRLMSIVGHLMQLRTLKRNLRFMANMGLSAKQEKEDQIEKIKQEVAEMVKQRILYMKSKAQPLAASSDDFQEAGQEEKEVLKRKYSMDDLLGNKINDLYDLFVERADEDSGSASRRLYQELVALWPSEFMDTDGIKRAIFRAKDRRRGLCNLPKDREKIKNKKVLPPKPKDATNVSQPSHTREKPLSDSRSPLTKKPVFSARKPIALVHGPKIEKRNQEKKGRSNGNPVDAVASNSTPRKKVKKKPKLEALEAQIRLERPVLQKHVGQSSS